LMDLLPPWGCPARRISCAGPGTWAHRGCRTWGC
jgi:hypothetical protein